MARIIKFRVWDNRTKEMVIDKNQQFDDLIIFIKGELIISDRFTLMQFIGIKDKNGVEIFEGDVLRYNYHIVYEESWKGSRENRDFFGIVEYHDKILKIGYESDETRFVGFILCGCKETDEEYFTTIPQLEDIEVIGNIYENPEFLKEKKC